MENTNYKFLRTTKSGKGRATHYHIAYVNDQSKTALLSTDANHNHQIQWQEGQEAQPLNPLERGIASSSPLQWSESIIAKWIISPAKDGHTHELGQEVPEKDETNKEEDEDIVRDVRGLWKECLELEKDYITRGEESDGFYSGISEYDKGKGQWDKGLKSELTNSQRAALTINEIEPKIDILSGHQRQNRLDIKYFPVEEGDATTAEILNVLAKNVLEQNNFDFEETEAFEDQAITGRGNIDIRVDYDKNLEGDIVVEWYPWKQVKYGPHNKKDASDCEYMFKHQMHSKAFLKNMWPDKADDIEAEYKDTFSDTHRDIKPDQYESPDAKSENVTADMPMNKRDTDFVDLAKKKFMVLECWRRKYKRVSILVNIADKVYHNAEYWSSRDISSIKTMADFDVVEVKRHRMRVTFIANTVLLEDKYPDLPVQDIHTIPLYGKKRGKYIWGKVESAKDPQREVDKRHSQIVDILNKVASYGWFYDNETFAGDKKEETNFKNNSSTPGFIQKVNSVKNLPEKVEGVKFPGEIAAFHKLSSDKIKEIMNVNLELLGLSSGATSGIQELRRARQALIGNEFLFDNLSLAKRKLGRMLAAYIQHVYTVERMIRILENRASRGDIVQPKNVPVGSPMEQLIQQSEGLAPKYDPAVLKTLLENADLTKYDVAVGESAYSPTNRQANFIIWLEAAKTGVPVPPAILYDLSDLPDKEKAKQAVAQMMAEQKAEAEKTRQTELIKSGVNPQTGMKEQTGGGVK